jgi:hypothetical protein
MILFYSVMFACTLNMLTCVPLIEYEHPFVSKVGCMAYVTAIGHRLYGRDLEHPIVMGRCRPWYK